MRHKFTRSIFAKFYADQRGAGIVQYVILTAIAASAAVVFVPEFGQALESAVRDIKRAL